MKRPPVSFDDKSPRDCATNFVTFAAPGVRRAAEGLENEGLLLRSADGGQWLAARKRPHRDVDLRGSGASFMIEDEDGSVIGVVDVHHAARETHPGAVQLHARRSYIVRAVDMGARRARAAAEQAKWHTRVRTAKSTEILETWAEAEAFGAPVRFGRLRVTETVTGYERRLNGSLQLMDIRPLDLPPQIFTTEGLWFLIPDECRAAVEDGLYHFMGAIHALEHTAIGLMPLMVMADRNDLGGISIPMHPQTGTPAVFIYDGLPGGAGLTRSAFPLLEQLLLNVRRTLRTCPCETGCPSCIQSPKCGSGNRPLDKAGCLFLTERLIGGLDRERGVREVPLPDPQAFSSGRGHGGGRESDPQEMRPGESPAVSSEDRASISVPMPETCAGGTCGPGGRRDAAASGSEASDGWNGEAENVSPACGNPSDASGAAGGAHVRTTHAVPLTKGPVMVFDVETRRSAAEVGGWNRACDMGVSVAVVWDGSGYRTFRQEQLGEMLDLLRSAGLVVGFNSFRFDYAVLQPFAGFDLHDLPGLDMLDDIRRRLNYGVSLDNLGRSTLDAPKSADGLLALKWWKEGRIDEIAEYCRMDVEITRRLYEFGRDNGYLIFTNKAGSRVRVPVSWGPSDRNGERHTP
ncbi:MAG: DUF1998 domain-containing protein [Mailhella sp.]|nr:DUF1998 domain-containing protein [Mailhella sp.]